ncbi:sigma factor, partial [Actinoplanes sp. NPDC048791]|uniref:sigma factor n=1 Tax=Actinoplanes sp. NPDC048791 TaxID=3154623 RepID=UPI0033D53355
MTAADPLTALALAARSGDADAQAALVRGTQAEVWRFTAALVDPGAADDLTQETYLRAFKALPGFVGRAMVRTWLLGIARRTCADHLRA